MGGGCCERSWANTRRNSKDVKDLYTYQQLYIYFIPILTNLGFINIIVVVVRLYWFKKHLHKVGKTNFFGLFGEPSSVCFF